MNRYRRSSSQSSSASLEDGELINEEEFKSDPRKSPPSGRTNANLWRDIVVEQNLEEQMHMGTSIAEREITRRGVESYEIPDYDKMDHEELIKQQNIVNESLRKVTSHADDLFGPSDEVDHEYGTNARKFRKRVLPSDRIPIASKEAEQNKKSNPNWKRPRFNNDLKTNMKSEPSPPESRSSSQQGYNRKKNKYGSKMSLASNGSRNADLPIPVSLVTEGYSLEKLLAAELDLELSDENFALQLADALGEMLPEMIVYCVHVVGKETANRLFKKTQDVERNGGMHIDNSTRRRTPGGVFLKLLRSDKIIPPEARNDVRDFGHKLYAQQQKLKKEADADLPSLPKASDVLKPVISNDVSME